MAERGVIRNREYAQQIRDFSGLRFGCITPTDIDAFIDFGNTLFIFIEGKHGDAAMPTGQRLAFERVVDACEAKGHRRSYGLVVRHDVLGDIPFAETIVTRIRHAGHWQSPKQKNVTLRQAIDALRDVSNVATTASDPWLAEFDAVLKRSGA